jgi:hypothetical protein
MAANFKMAEELVFHHKSMSFGLFCVLFFILGLYFEQAYFLEEKFFVRFKMASHVQDGGRKSSSMTLRFDNIFAFSLLQLVCILTSNMTQTHILSNQQKNGKKW